MDNDLHLPAFESDPLPPSLRSMDEVDQWIEEIGRASCRERV
jgi:hypothetical protein